MHSLECKVFEREMFPCMRDVSEFFRERHAKTLEIAQEEVLTCLGICIAERLHRIHRRMKEEETVCQVLAAVAVDALSRNFRVTTFCTIIYSI